MTSPPRILLVGGSADERERYAEHLREKGFMTLQAGTAADGHRLATELQPAAVVTDVRLDGDENGLELTRRLKQDTRLGQIPIVVLTGAVFTHDREAAARAGCDLFVAKPCLPDLLFQVVARLIAPRSAACMAVAGTNRTGSDQARARREE